MTAPVVLVVDDNPMTRKMVRFALEKKGYTVVDAPDGNTALRLMAEAQPSLVLQDLILPDMDGFDLVAKLRQIPRGGEVPILAFSGFLSNLDEARLTAAGFDDLVTKPIEPSLLLRIIQAYLPVQKSPVAPFGHGLRLLVVDDDPVQRKLACFRLASLGFEVISAGDGVEALERARAATPHVIVSDIMMPRLDGYGLCSAIRREPALAQTPLILTTSTYIDAADRALAERVGASRYVLRTPELVELIEAVRESLTAPSPPPHQRPDSADVEKERAQRILSQLDKQVARNAGMTQRTAQLAAELSVLSGISDALSRRRDIDAALDEVLAACFDAGGISVGALYLMNGDGGFRARPFGGAAGAHAHDLETFYDHPELLLAIVASGVATTLPSSAIPDHQSRTILEQSGASTALVVPLVHMEERFGALFMVSKSIELGQEDRVSFARSVANQIALALILARTFSEVERTEAEARRQATLLRSIIDSIGDGIVVADEGGQVFLWNRAASEMAPQGVGAPIERRADMNGLYRRDQVTLYATDELPLARAVRGESVDQDEMFARPPGKSEGRWLSVSGRPLRDEQGVARGGVVVFRDVTREKSTHEQLVVSDRMASVGMLAAGVAHEINNPLAAVIANIDLGLRDLVRLARELGPRAVIDDLTEELREASEAAERVRQIVRDLKIFSRAEEDKRGPVDVERVLDSSVRMAWNEIRHRARLVKDYQGVPPVAANESRLGQVFLNLIVNAAQAIDEGWVEENAIHVTTRVDGAGRVVVDIADTGHGIAPDVMRRLFTPFFTTKPVGVGTGLGLSICHRIVSGLGGEITVDSELRKGTVFHVALPAAAAERPDAPEPHAAAARPVRRGRVLIIDDEPTILAAIRRNLAGEHDVTPLVSAAVALEKLVAGVRFDVILCDLMMPEMTGIEFFGELSKIAPEQAMRIIFMTGGAFTARARAFLDEAPNARIEKPFNMDELRTLVNDRVRASS